MFCPKCGKEIPDQAVFCPKCGASINASGGQPQPAPTQPAAPSNPSGVPGAATPTQEKAGKTLLLILVLNLILAGLWLSDMFRIYDSEGGEAYSIMYFLSYVGPGSRNFFFFTCAFALLCPAVSGIFLKRHMSRQDGKVNISFLSWLYLIWIAGICALIVYLGLDATGDGSGMMFGFTVFGWLYILCCVALAVVLIYLTGLHFKAAKERKAQPNS